VAETKGIHLATPEDTDYKRSIFDVCNEHAQKVGWAKLAPKMQNIGIRFSVLDQDDWKSRLNAMLT